MKKTVTATNLMPKYVSRFECIGGDCEDTCTQYRRKIHPFGDLSRMTLNLSCPEHVLWSLLAEDAFDFTSQDHPVRERGPVTGNGSCT